MKKQLEQGGYIHTSLNGRIHLWHRESFEDFDVIEKYASNISDTNHSNIKILKSGTRRKVLKFGFSDSLVVKSYPLSSFRDKLKHHKYGLQEFLNYKKLSQYTFIPKHYAYFEKKEWFGNFINGNIIEYIQGSPLKDKSANFFRHPSSSMDQFIELISLIHQNGIYHSDLSSDNIILSEDGIKIIDWQYCNLAGSRSDSQLVLMLSHLVRTCNIKNDADISEFLEKIHQKCDLGLTFGEFQELILRLSDQARVPRKTLTTLTISELRKRIG